MLAPDASAVARPSAAFTVPAMLLARADEVIE